MAISAVILTIFSSQPQTSANGTSQRARLMRSSRRAKISQPEVNTQHQRQALHAGAGAGDLDLKLRRSETGPLRMGDDSAIKEAQQNPGSMECYELQRLAPP